MKRFVVGVIAVAVLVSTARTASAQAKTVSSEMRTETGTVEAIDAATRTVTLKKADGTVGDKVTARFYENVVVRLKKPGEPDVASATKATTPAEQVLPGGTKAKQVTITATITAINPEVPSITFSGPTGLKYTSKVLDKEALAKVKVGDKFDIVWTEAVLVSVEPGK